LSLAQEAVVPQEYNRVVRSKGYGDWRSWLNADDIAYTNAEWGSTISALDYMPGVARKTQVINTETTTEYVKQFDPSLNSVQ
jgi:hypothetical protein